MILNEKQREAVFEMGHCNVVACPGSGKTRVIIEKTIHILERNPKASIVIVSFTNESVSEIKRRISSRIGADMLEGISIGTFHSLSLILLKSNHEFANCTIISEIDRAKIIKEIVSQGDNSVSVHDLTQTIRKKKSTLKSIVLESAYEKAYSQYKLTLSDRKLIDFDDLLLYSVKGIRAGSISSFKADYLLVDEFQDADFIQLEWVSEHASRGTITTIVGDDDQAIYSWRCGMGYPGMLEFEKRFSAKRIILQDNYRNSLAILIPASRLIGYNVNRVQKSIVSHRGDGGYIFQKSYANRLEEVTAIAKMVSKRGGSWAILARTNYLINYMELALCAAGILYRYSANSKTVWKVYPVYVMLETLRSIVHNTDKGIIILLTWLGLNQREIEIVKYNAPDGIPAKLRAKIPTPGLTNKSQEMLEKLSDHLSSWYNLLPVDEDHVVASVARWMKKCDRSPSSNDYYPLVSEALIKRAGSLSQKLREIDKPLGTAEQDIFLSTLHGSKGMEFNNVWIFGVEKEILPLTSKYGNSSAEETVPMDEERRLLYVGMTRAVESLIVSSAGKDNGSPFLNEINIFGSLS